ncbi:protein RFT1 homolog isoform X1 [Harmonia axyridis]|uniref:protein RFT1 homolog isoform X1 n=2 Tax=Harmonia axyridis TaxID=115357 RepID=UPI001E274E67|nr:protein RFT1 homolog isoform X1 [Harmonia axyridis]
MGRNILESSLKYASFSIIFQVLFRCITFVLNAFIVRTLGHEVLGIMNVRLLLLESTILFLSKEPLLKACLTNTKSHNWAQVINLIWLSIPIAFLLSICLVYIWLNVLSPVDDIFLEQYKWGCYSIALSCIIEQCTQSIVLVVQSFCFVKLKIILDTIYILVRTFIFVCLVMYNPYSAIGAFAIAQIISAIILGISYFVFFAWYIPNLKMHNKKEQTNSQLFDDMKDFPFRSILDFFPGMMKNENNMLNKELCVLTMSFTRQSLVKQILTEGEKYVMTISPVMTFTQQSMYDIVNNLGSLAARFIFRPIEESAYFYFTQMVQRDVPVKNQNKESISESALVLKQLCNVIISFGLVIFVFGQSYSYTLLYLYGGQNLVNNMLPVTLLKFHCFAIILLAINGVTEGFVFATMSNKQLDRYNYVMVLFSVIFLIISYVLTILLGPVGFIIANCINMLSRITHSFHYIRNMYRNSPYKPLDGLRPSWKFISVLLISSYCTKLSEGSFLRTSIFAHIFIGAIFFFLTIVVWSLDNKELLKIGYDKYKRKQLKK